VLQISGRITFDWNKWTEYFPIFSFSFLVWRTNISQSLETQTERKTTINKFFQEGIERKRKVVKEKKMLNLNGHKGKKFSLQLAIVVIIEKYRVISFQSENFY
jgi:hypothetical protein